MALTTFQFQASLPANRASLATIRPLVQQVLTYTGYPAGESGTIAAAIESVAIKELPASGTGHVTIRFDKNPRRLMIALTASHLSETAPPAGLMDSVTVDRGGSAPSYRYERRAPEAS
jgi:hypothetical protein